jgi:hypothetical protein
MKSVALVVVALGLLLAMAAPSLAHGYWAPVHHHYYGPYYYGGYRPVVVAPTVVAPAPVYGYAPYSPAYPPVVAPAYSPVVTSPYYYYGAPGVSFGYRGPRVSIGLGF